MTASISYNMFRRLDNLALFCVVPQDRPVPTTLDGSAWKYEATVCAPAALTSGFSAELARECCDRNGSYVFMLARPRIQRPGRDPAWPTKNAHVLVAQRGHARPRPERGNISRQAPHRI